MPTLDTAALLAENGASITIDGVATKGVVIGDAQTALILNRAVVIIIGPGDQPPELGMIVTLMNRTLRIVRVQVLEDVGDEPVLGYELHLRS